MSQTGFSKPTAARDGAPRDAATVLLLRDRDLGGIEVFVVRRHGASAFMGGAFVFPGGKVDATDAALAGDGAVPALSLTPGRARSAAETRAVFAAALRELHEEAGLLFTRAPLDAAARARVRQTGAAKASLADALAAEGAHLDLAALTPWAHWITPSAEPRRFDTHFFLARAPADQRAEVDEHEATEGRWVEPSEALRRQDAGEMFLPPPTLVNIAQLAEHARVDDVLAAARRRVIAPILPKLTTLDGQIAIVLPWDSQFAALEGDALAGLDPHPMADHVSRVVLDGERWRLASG